jgi:hypothetical protein
LRTHTADGCYKAGQDEMRGFHDQTSLVEKKWASSATQVNAWPIHAAIKKPRAVISAAPALASGTGEGLVFHPDITVRP